MPSHYSTTIFGSIGHINVQLQLANVLGQADNGFQSNLFWKKSQWSFFDHKFFWQKQNVELSNQTEGALMQNTFFLSTLADCFETEKYSNFNFFSIKCLIWSFEQKLYEFSQKWTCNIRPEDTYWRKIKLSPKTTG